MNSPVLLEVDSEPPALLYVVDLVKDDGSVALLFKTHPAPDARLDKLSVAMGERFDKVAGETVAQIGVIRLRNGDEHQTQVR